MNLLQEQSTLRGVSNPAPRRLPFYTCLEVYILYIYYPEGLDLLVQVCLLTVGAKLKCRDVAL